MKKKTKAIISLALASTIAITVAGCSAKDKKPDGEYVNSSSQEQTVTNSNEEIVTVDGSETTNSTADSTTAKKTKKAKKVKEKPTKPYYVTNISGNKISTTAPNNNNNNNNDKNASTTTTKKGETTTKHYEGTTTYTTRPSNAPIELPALPEEDYVLSDSMALSNLQVNYPEKWINYFYDYDPNNKGDRAYFAVFTNPDKHTITSVITVDLKTGKANERDLKTDKVTSIKVL
ncbi:hypothetical protein [Eubacterium coprostanoligenes]|uniref:Lipoprotein n=1 Tax=Eubacterium coprostanoligenes TaxID=290054 RepID=A0A1T4LBD9_9FIRM|nr:hypothetical protein [Eubacterium coprostanoligenes]SJZ51817.1 hypothetical protein SAMN02745114_00824 [Eubacterium coprostanoligenes]